MLLIPSCTQVGAVEGLAFLSGIALAGRLLSCREVLSPIVLILLFRQVGVLLMASDGF